MCPHIGRRRTLKPRNFCLSYIVCVKWGKSAYCCCFVMCCFLDLQCTCAISIQLFLQAFYGFCLKGFPFFFIREMCFHMFLNLSIAVHTLTMKMLTLFSDNEILLPRYMNSCINLRSLTFNEEDGTIFIKTHGHYFI